MIEKDEMEIKAKLFGSLIQIRTDWDETVVATNVNKVFAILRKNVQQ